MQTNIGGEPVYHRESCCSAHQAATKASRGRGSGAVGIWDTIRNLLLPNRQRTASAAPAGGADGGQTPAPAPAPAPAAGGADRLLGSACCTDASVPSAADPHHRTEQEQAVYHSGVRGAIFSRWSTRDTPVDLTFVRPASDGFVESAGYEGDFVSGRRPYAWGVGAYTFSVRKTTYERDPVTGAESTWCEASVTDQATKHTTFITSLKFPGRTLAFWPKNSAFVEIYGGGELLSQADLRALPEMQVRFGCPRINGAAVEVDKVVEAHPSEGVPPCSPPIMRTEMQEPLGFGEARSGGGGGGDDGDDGGDGGGVGGALHDVVCTLNGMGVERTSNRRDLYIKPLPQ
jgi:hypothetical protein